MTEWARHAAQHAETGLWPLLVVGEEPTPLEPRTAPIPEHDAAQLLRDGWQRRHADAGRSRWFGAREPAPWPGLAPSLRDADPAADPIAAADALAVELAEELADDSGRLLLVPAPRSADALWAAGWPGPLPDIGLDRMVAVLRSWEDRFGARVVACGPGLLYVAVAAPPQTLDDARLVAAEHLWLCPEVDDADRHAPTLVGTASWVFWWQ